VGLDTALRAYSTSMGGPLDSTGMGGPPAQRNRPPSQHGRACSSSVSVSRRDSVQIAARCEANV